MQQQLPLGITQVAVIYQGDGFGNALLGEIKRVAAVAQAQPQAIVIRTAGQTFTALIQALTAATARPVVYGFSVASTARRHAGQRASLFCAPDVP